MNMVMVPRNNDLLVWAVMMMMMARNGMNNILVMRGDSRGRKITIVVHSPHATTITVMVVVVMVMVAVVRCARIMNMAIWKSGRHFNEDIYYGSHAYHQTTVDSVALSIRTGSSGDPIRTNEDNCRWWTMRSENTHSDFPALLVDIAIVVIRGDILFSVRTTSRRNLLIIFVTRTTGTVT
jgi:hypothetical protein